LEYDADVGGVVVITAGDKVDEITQADSILRTKIRFFLILPEIDLFILCDTERIFLLGDLSM
jgi:hypothetical protein